MLLFVVLIFPKSEVLASHLPECSTLGRQTEKIPTSDLIRDDANCPGETVCIVKEGLIATTSYQCHKVKDGTAAPGAPKTTTATGPTTSAKGIPCGIYSGSRNYSGGIETAIGCVPTEPKALVEGLLKYGTFAAGGIAFLIMILAALQMITAEGNPESIKGAQEKFYSAIIGLLLIVFAVLLMQVIGVDILGLKGFSAARSNIIRPGGDF